MYLQAVWRAEYFLTCVARERVVRVALPQLVFMLRFHGIFKMFIFLVEGCFHVFRRKFSFRKIIAFITGLV